MKDFVKRYKWKGPVFEISALTHDGCQHLVQAIYQHVASMQEHHEERDVRFDGEGDLLPADAGPDVMAPKLADQALLVVEAPLSATEPLRVSDRLPLQPRVDRGRPACRSLVSRLTVRPSLSAWVTVIVTVPLSTTWASGPLQAL